MEILHAIELKNVITSLYEFAWEKPSTVLDRANDRFKRLRSISVAGYIPPVLSIKRGVLGFL